MERINRTLVRSSNVRSYGYDPQTRTIQVQFTDGKIYEYYNRAPSVWRDFQLSQSKGSFVQNKLTPAGNYKRVA